MALTYQQAVEQTIIGAEQFHEIINGSATSEIVVEDGSKIPSVRKALIDNFYYKDPIDWQQGQSELVFNQIRKFTDGTWWIAPNATATNPVVMGITPYGDPLWKVFSWDRVIDSQKANRKLIERSWAEAGYSVVAGSFQEGATLNTTTDVVINYGSDFGIYSWGGTLPKVVAANSSPAGTGGVAPTSWIDKSNLTVLDYLINIDGYGRIGVATYTTLRSYIGDSSRVKVSGRNSVFDGAGGEFVVDLSDNITQDNDGTVIVDAVGRRWKRLFCGDINVLWFGADPTGTNNSRQQINNAISFSESIGGGVVYIPSGIYKVAGEAGGTIASDRYVILKSNVALRGDSQGSSILLRGSAQTVMSVDVPDISVGFSGHSNIILDSITIDGNTSQYFIPSNLVKIESCTNLIVRNCTLKNVPGLHALDLNRVRHAEISNNRFYGTSLQLAINFGGVDYKPEAIQLAWGDSIDSPYYCEDIKIYNNIFDKNEELIGSDYFISACGNHSSLNSTLPVMRDIEFYGNTVRGCSQAGIKALPCVNFSVHDNYFYDCNNVFGLYANFHQEFGSVDIKNVSFKNNVIIGLTDSVVYTVQPTYTSVSTIQKIVNLTIDGNVISDQSSISTRSIIDCVIVDGYFVSNNTVLDTCYRFLQHEYCSNSLVNNNDISYSKLNAINIIEQRNPALNTGVLSRNINITGNNIRAGGQRGIHVNCQAKNVSITSNIIMNVNMESGGAREAVKVDSYPTNVLISGNTISYDNGVPYTYGILASTVNECHIAANRVKAGSLGSTSTEASGVNSTIFLDGVPIIGSPEGVHNATVGSSVCNINGGVGTTLYVKETGSGRTGWIAK